MDKFKTFLLNKKTLIIWSVFLLLSILFMIVVLEWSLFDSIYFVTLYSFFKTYVGVISDNTLFIIGLVYSSCNFLIYTFNLYNWIKNMYS